jgi:hypothetical protein
MPIGKTKAFKTLGNRTKTGNFFERLETRKQKQINELERQSGLKETDFKKEKNSRLVDKQKIYLKYKTYRKNAKEIINQTASMLEKLSKDSKLRNAEFVFIDRDALPYMFVAREICSKYGLKKEQFKKILSSKEAEVQIDTKLVTTINPKEYMSLESNSHKLKEISKKIPLTTAVIALKSWIKKNITLSKPIVIIDSGYNGTSVKRLQMVLADINPNIKSYSAMFFATPYSKPKLDYYSGDTDITKFGISDIEGLPKFQGKLLKIEKGKPKREKISAQELRIGDLDTVMAEVSMIALRNTLARYKKEKGIL